LTCCPIQPPFIPDNGGRDSFARGFIVIRIFFPFPLIFFAGFSRSHFRPIYSMLLCQCFFFPLFCINLGLEDVNSVVPPLPHPDLPLVPLWLSLVPSIGCFSVFSPLFSVICFFFFDPPPLCLICGCLLTLQLLSFTLPNFSYL